ncbi:MAG: glycosyl hydrolase [Propionibacteriaceae bacterium]|nr:glycosyl hydrolase [Propionibacteriaceae bacterium]
MTLTRRQALLGLTALPLLAAGCAGPTPGTSTPKKGVGAWEFDGLRSAMIQTGASWYFNWRSDPLPGVRGVEFVPMIFGAGEVTDDHLADAVRHGSALQGFNEPDLPHQANLTVDHALALWPQLMETRLRLGSPATSAPADTSPWLAAFLDGVWARGLRVDFLCVHWYDHGADVAAGVTALRDHLHRVHERYGLPVWLTEFAMIDWLGEHPRFPDHVRQGEYAAACVAMLEALTFVERYAWFALPPWQPVSAVNLFDPGPVITPAGEAYARAG